MTVQPIREPQDRRPKAQATRARTRKQAQMDAEGVGMRVDGVDYVINPHDLTGRVERDIRNELGMGLAELHERLGVSPGLDYVGMFMWAVRYANGEHDADLDEILDEIRADSDVVILKEEDVAGAAGPKAPGRSASKHSRPSPQSLA